MKDGKILLITNIPTPYRIPLFNEVSRQLEKEGLRLKVVFGALGYARRKWVVNMSDCKFDYIVLPGKTIRFGDVEEVSFSYPGLYRIISEERPSAIVTNAFSIATTKLWWRSWFKRTPYIIWSGAIHRKGESDFFLRELQRKILIKRAIGFIVYGTKAKEYLTFLGAVPDKIEIGINTTDTQFYMTKVKRLHKNLMSGDGKKHLLYIGHLLPRKDVSKVLKSINILAKSRSDFMLDIVGDGEERDRLEKYVIDNQLVDFVKFYGFKQKSDMPKFMAQSECFLFQTNFDIWGLSLVEAMAAGLPCVASIYAGATFDLIKDEITGFAMDFSEIEKVTKKINWILENVVSAKEIGRNASSFISRNASIEKSAAGFVKAIMRDH